MNTRLHEAGIPISNSSFSFRFFLGTEIQKDSTNSWQN